MQMEGLDFQFALSDTEKASAIEQLANICVNQFGPVNTKRHIDQIQKLQGDGSYAALSRLIFRTENGIIGANIRAMIFTPNNEGVYFRTLSEQLDEDGNEISEDESIPELVYDGISVEFIADTGTMDFNVNSYKTNVIVNVNNGIEVDQYQRCDEGIDGSDINPVTPELTHLLYLKYFEEKLD